VPRQRSDREARPRYDGAPRAAAKPDDRGGEPVAAAPPAPARERPPRPRYDITCMECGAAAQVPFKPIEGRQIFCQPCYRLRKGVSDQATEGATIAEGDAGIVE